MKKITIYSTPTCHYCKVAKEFFDLNGLRYKEIDVQKDIEARKKMVEISGQMGVPVIVIGKKVLNGFSEEIVEAALK
jgi:glutaredoxin-like YruB-family protein